MSTFLSNTNPNPNKSFEVYIGRRWLLWNEWMNEFWCIALQVNEAPTDSVSSLCFSPKANFLVATSWDNQVGSFLPSQFSPLLLLILGFPFYWFNSIAGSMLGGSTEWRQRCHSAQGIHIAWPSGNLIFSSLLSFNHPTLFCSSSVILCIAPRFCVLLGRMMAPLSSLAAVTSKWRCGHSCLADNLWPLPCMMPPSKKLLGFLRWIF